MIDFRWGITTLEGPVRNHPLTGHIADIMESTRLTHCMVRPCIARGFRRGGGERSCINVYGLWVGWLCPEPSWKSARLRSHYRTDLSGPFGSPVLAGAGKTDPPSRLISRRPRREAGTMSTRAPHLPRTIIGSCRRKLSRLEVAPMGEDAPGDASQLVSERDRQHVVMQAPSGGLDPGFEPVTLPAAGISRASWPSSLSRRLR
jgi:hypothetical protein